MSNKLKKHLVLAVSAAAGMTPVALAGTLDRLKGVSQHAQEKASGGPENLWLGVGLFLVFALAVGVAAWWSSRRKRR